MTDKERAFLDEIQAVCRKHGIEIIDCRESNGVMYFSDCSGMADNSVLIPITDDLLEE